MKQSTDVILAVDLDGSLTFADTLHESLVKLLRQYPLKVFVLPFWLLAGKAAFKAKVADHVALAPQTLPYNQALIAWLKTQRQAGRKLVLCTASDQRIASSVSDYVNCFDEVIASDGTLNNAGKTKRAILEAKYGFRGYDYVGNAKTDVKVWAGARRAIVVSRD